MLKIDTVSSCFSKIQTENQLKINQLKTEKRFQFSPKHNKGRILENNGQQGQILKQFSRSLVMHFFFTNRRWADPRKRIATRNEGLHGREWHEI